MRTVSRLALALALLPCAALAASPQLFVHRVQIDRSSWPRARGYLTLVSASGGPMPALGPDLFRVYETGQKAGSKILKAETLDAAGEGASVLLVLQASGAMAPLAAELSQAASGFIASLGAKDVAGCVSYGDSAELVAPLSFDKADVARKCGTIAFNAKSFLLYDGLMRAIAAFPPDDARGNPLPGARAVVLVADGRDNGSAADIETVVGEARKRGIPVHAVGHSEVEQEPLAQLAQISVRTSGTYRPAPAPTDVLGALSAVRDLVHFEYLLEWKTELPHDGKDHRVEIALQVDSNTLLQSALTASAAIFYFARKRPHPVRRCALCHKKQMPEWDACPRCLEEAQALFLVQKGLDKGKRFPLLGKSVSLGSGPDNVIRLADGAVSGKHAGLSIEAGRFEIVDLGSRNGVLVNGLKTPRRLLEDGDLITLGVTELKFERRTPGDAGPARW